MSARDASKSIDLIKKEGAALVSIRDTSPDEETQQAYDIIDSSGIDNLYVANFDDLEFELDPKYGKQEKPPEQNQIEDILKWAKKKMDSGISYFVVHCTAGISRSSATAILIKALHNPEEAMKVINPLLHSPNRRVIEFGEKIIDNLSVSDDIDKMEKEYSETFLHNYDYRFDSPF